MNKAYFVYFSPTGTTRQTMNKIADGLGVSERVDVDITLPAARVETNLLIEDGDIVIFGAPTYSGRVEATAEAYLKKFKGKGQAAACVVVYGNREYEDALLELSDIASAGGFSPIAGGAFIGEHSFSTAAIEIAPGRPDPGDGDQATAFGRKLAEKLLQGEFTPPQIPGDRPYRERGKRAVNFTPQQTDQCTTCLACRDVCPVGAIDEEAIADTETCIFCQACVKNCEFGGRSCQEPKMAEVQAWLAEQSRKEPEYFI